MSQFFSPTAYDVDTRTKFTARCSWFEDNSYNYHDALSKLHYLLRQQPYRVMWGGCSSAYGDNFLKFPREEDLLGLSTFLDLYLCRRNLVGMPYFDKIEEIEAYSKEWTDLDIWREAYAYFDWDNTKSVSYTGYLVNHTKKLAVSLSDYFANSCIYKDGGALVCIDPLPVLTETGDAMRRLLNMGMFLDTTDELAGTWCGDLLEIVDKLPAGYAMLSCCFANIEGRASYCYNKYGSDEIGFLLKDSDYNLFKGVRVKNKGEREVMSFQVVLARGRIKFFEA